MNYDRNFVSCEDGLPRMASAPLIFNVACTCTSVVIMAVPLYYLYQAFWKNHTKEVKYYSLSQTLAFCGNLHEHWTGYLGPPCMDTLSLVNNAVLAAVIYRAWYHDHRPQPTTMGSGKIVFTPVMPTTFTHFVLGLCFIFLFTGPLLGTKAESFLTMLCMGPVGLGVVIMMGRVTHYQTQQRILANVSPNRWSFGGTCSSYTIYWISVALMVTIVASVQVEPIIYQTLAASGWAQRAYHAVFLHTIIPALFVCLGELVMDINASKTVIRMKAH